MKSWWSMPARSPRERTVRAAAKAEYEATHPLPEPKLRPVRTGWYTGYYVSQSGREHFFGGQPDRRVAEMAACADTPPVPDSLRPFDRDGRLFWLGQRGIYSIDISTPEAFRASLKTAINSDSLQQATAAPAGLPGNER
jgi:hypothetical protein